MVNEFVVRNILTSTYVRKKLCLLLFFSAAFASCSQFSNSITSKLWHNVNAKYNALWIAKVNYAFVEDTLFSLRNENYTEVLPVLLPIDTLKNVVVSKELDEVIQKASRVAERHSNAKYLDEAYNLLGKARVLKADYLNAAEVFKYVNSNGTNETQKHAALISLMRVYVEQNDLKTANEVSDVIKVMKLSGDNLTDYYLTKAYYHQKNDEELLAAAIIDEALKLLPKGERKARLYFMVGQLYDKYDRPDLAEQRFLQVEKNKPNYDLSFNAQVNLLSTRASMGKGGRSSVAEFEKMLADRKNADLLDRIYFKMGSLEAEQSNYPKAIRYFQLSGATATAKEGKAKAYLALADLHYDLLADFETAASYYDSTLLNLSSADKNYQKVTTKTNSLSDLIRYKRIIMLEDSLQKLSKMNPVALNKKLEEIIETESREKQKMIKLVSNNTTSTSRLPSLQNRWELYDAVKIAQGKTAFTQKWGSRPLADNWRRREQQAASVGIKIERLSEEEIRAEELTTQNKTAELQAADDKLLREKKAALLEKIPTDPIKFAASEFRQQEALFELGKLYQQKFEQTENARNTFQELLQRFPDSPNAPEALYYLAIMSESPNENPFKSALISQYPDSFFTKKLARGSIEVTDGMEAAAKRFYEELYATYSAGNQVQALEMANKGIVQYAGTALEDRIAFLRIYILAKGKDVVAYKQAIDNFISSFPNSMLSNNVKSMQALTAQAND